MFTTKIHQIDRKKMRLRAFTFLAVGLSIILLLAGTFEFIPAWVLRDPADDIHLWHIAELAALGTLLLGGVIIALIRRPQEKPLLAQFFLLSLVILIIGIMPFNIDALALGVGTPMFGLGTLPLNTISFGLLFLAASFALAYPYPRALLDFSQKGRRISVALLVLTLIFAVFLDPVINKEIYYQIVGLSNNDAHALQYHWIGSALLMVLLIVAGVLASTKRPGWKILGFITGEVYIYLGIITMIVPNNAGSWGEASGLFTIFGGVLYILIVLTEAEGESEGISPSVPEPVITSETVPEAEAAIPPESVTDFVPVALPARTTQQLMENEMRGVDPTAVAQN
jgi:hypothetical protein